MKNFAVLAPHPDDETLGCGGTILKLRSEGWKADWILGTEAKIENGFSSEFISKRESEIKKVTDQYGFDRVERLGLSAAGVKTDDLGKVIPRLRQLMEERSYHTLLIPYAGDPHSDHKLLTEAVLSAAKWFRAPSLRRIWMYETPSETDMNPLSDFRANTYINITNFLDQKLKTLKVYESELGNFPFPRSIQAVEALARVRGAQCGFNAAEAFMSVKEVIE
jgi:N-acetylglucosamine malate deacetylase 1